MPDDLTERPTAKLRVRPPGEVDDPSLSFARLSLRRNHRRLAAIGFGQQFVLVRAPGDVRHPHAHDYDARVHVLKGQITIDAPSGSEILLEGEERLIEAGTRHTEATGPEGVVLLVGCR